MDDEAVIGEVLPIAQAARKHGGIVLAQVKRLLDRPASPQQVRVPGILVDRIVVAKECEHDQTFGEVMNLAYCSAALGAELDSGTEEIPRMAPGPRRIIAARACDELKPGDIANLGIGMPEGIARIAAERDLLRRVTLTLESGPIGGMPAGGLSFGASAYPQAIIDQPAQFDFYDGGGLSFAALGAAQIDRHGNVNVSRFGTRLAGVGGFVNISQNTRRLVFCGTFTSSGLNVRIDPNGLHIESEGGVRKFVDHVEQISYSGIATGRTGQSVLYITERAVFQWTDAGLELERDIVDQMDFKPIIKQIRPMPPHVFSAETGSSHD